MLRPFKLMLAVAAVAGLSALLTPSQAQSSKSGGASAKSDAAAATSKSPAAVDEFEENRRAHMQKSKENNAKKGAE